MGFLDWPDWQPAPAPARQPLPKTATGATYPVDGIGALPWSHVTRQSRQDGAGGPRHVFGGVSRLGKGASPTAAKGNCGIDRVDWICRLMLCYLWPQSQLSLLSKVVSGPPLSK